MTCNIRSVYGDGKPLTLLDLCYLAIVMTSADASLEGDQSIIVATENEINGSTTEKQYSSGTIQNTVNSHERNKLIRENNRLEVDQTEIVQEENGIDEEGNVDDDIETGSKQDADNNEEESLSEFPNKRRKLQDSIQKCNLNDKNEKDPSIVVVRMENGGKNPESLSTATNGSSKDNQDSRLGSTIEDEYDSDACDTKSSDAAMVDIHEAKDWLYPSRSEQEISKEFNKQRRRLQQWKSKSTTWRYKLGKDNDSNLELFPKFWTRVVVGNKY